MAMCSAACPRKAPVNLADRAWFQRVVNNRNFTVSNYQIDRVSGKPGSLSIPVFDAKAKYSQWFTLVGLVFNSRGSATTARATLHVINRNGTIIAPTKMGGKVCTGCGY